jgi:hypothetical protein
MLMGYNGKIIEKCPTLKRLRVTMGKLFSKCCALKCSFIFKDIFVN